ncbi:MAG: hypothetical protein KDA86_22510 [Planctomycetaceae bacterium]|nr:hypothetical protein [Planctomycetaceae bacterium]
MDLEIVETVLMLDLEDLPEFQSRIGTERDQAGAFSRNVCECFRQIGTARYLLYSDVDAFRQNLSESAKLRKKLVDRFLAGEPIPPSTVSDLTYKYLLDALAAGDFEGAKQIAEVTEKRHDDSWTEGTNIVIQCEGSEDFAECFTYALKAFVLDRRGDMQHWTGRLEVSLRHPKMKTLAGYGQVLRGILDEDEQTANRGIQAVLEGHQKESKGSGLFAGTAEELICIWGIGISNLALHRGIRIDSSPPLIPGELLLR